MNRRGVLLGVLCLTALAGYAKSGGAWMGKVSPAERARANPYADLPHAVAAGRNLFLNNCAKCHGENAQGKGSRPSLRSDRLRSATDGEIAWMLKNGQPFAGMPSWGGLPEPERWQIVAYLRSLNPRGPGLRP